MSNEANTKGFHRGDLPENAACGHEVIANANGIRLSVSSIATKGPCEWRSASIEGLSLGIVRGTMAFELGCRWRSELRGSYGFCLSTDTSIETRHAVHEETCIKAVFLHVPTAALDELQIPSMTAGRREASGTGFRNWTPNLRTELAANQIAACPFHGSLRTLYLQGKSLELLAIMLDDLAARTSIDRCRPSLSSADIERLMHARDILLAALNAPPSLDVLARHAGMSTSKLTVGFRRMFNMSVTEFVQERRLDAAWSVLTEGRKTVSQAAYAVGYSPAHFSTLFRRKFGFPPSTLARVDGDMLDRTHQSPK